MKAILWAVTVCCSCSAAVQAWAQPTDFPTRVAPFLSRYCGDCHRGAAADGNFDLEKLRGDFNSLREQESWSEIVNVLNSHQMPPQDSPQPAPEVVGEMVDWIAAQMLEQRLRRADAVRVLRRLNRTEYRNTMRDLLGVDVDVSGFPQDAAAGGFDNNGYALSLSPLLVELYYQAAERALDQVFVTGTQPPALKWRFQPESGHDDSNRVTYDGQRLIVNGGQNRVERDFAVMHHDSWDRTINVRDFRVPHPGRYKIRIRAAGTIPDRDTIVKTIEPFLQHRLENELRDHPNGETWHRRAFTESLEHFKTHPIYNYGPPRFKLVQTLGGQPRVLLRHDVVAPPSQPEVIEWEADFSTQSAGIELVYDYSVPKLLENFWCQGHDNFPRPELWIDWIELEGPLYESWPPAAHQRLLRTDQVAPRPTDDVEAVSLAAAILKPFMQRAYRRPVTDVEFQEKLGLFQQAYLESKQFIPALRYPLLSILVSPHFLYLPEAPMTAATTASGESDETSHPGGAKLLDHYALANRLSYFLWSSMPDDTLFALATQGRLHDPQVLDQQVDRMLADPKSMAMVENFAGQWLGLRQVGANPPAEDLFPEYDRHLEESMVGESLHFFAEILRQDLDVKNFIESDFLVVNERMARYYGLEGVKGDHFRPVRMAADIHRGGLVTQASILCITSNGTRTSPVVRGTWVLKTILGLDPGLPVANVGEIAPSVPGIDKATVRQRLEIHRQLPQCARCHDRIDPLGFALENYDAAGAYRTQAGFGYKGRIERNDPLIDASARMIDGREFVGAAGLKQTLLDSESLFRQSFSSKMLTYALGRAMGVADLSMVKAAAEELGRERTVRSLIKWIVKTESVLRSQN
jgi:hypothetical protein